MNTSSEQLPKTKILESLLAKDTGVYFEDALESGMVLNIGPQHPATHGVLRLLVQLDGETVIGCVPELGYLHRGFEKIAENSTYHEFIPHTDRLDYLAPLSNNTAFTFAVEKLAGIECTKRAQYIRMLISEMARIASHLVALGTMAMDVGALTVLLWGFREREKLQDIMDVLTGARFTTSYTRVGGVASDWTSVCTQMLEKFLDEFDHNLEEMEKLLNTNKIFLQRTENLGVISAEKAIDMGLTGPNLRASGVEYDLRRAVPYLDYNSIDFNIITYKEGDSLARYFVRCDEMRESAKILRQCLDKLPQGSIHTDDPKKVLPQKVDVYTKMEELIHDFMLINFGINPPVGEIYSSVENPKGELGFYLVSDGSGHPWRCKIRSPSMVNLQSLPLFIQGHMISDIVAVIGSMDPVMGEADK
ncbi:MAG: NADH dehydrogenase (quinone) subunit D [Ignavibacteria bacterium]|nr:NADH dehydrogenase (quinone) subunit D [Ignavibacteria bacterium]